MKTLEIYKNHWNFFSRKNECSLNSTNFPVAFFEIIALMAKDANYNLKTCYVNMNRLFIEGRIRDKENDLMLRYNYGNENSLVVARICFIHQRKGNMTELYRILKRVQRKYHTGAIEIESVQTDEMKAWCLKNGFVETFSGSKCYIEPQKKHCMIHS